MFALIIEQYCVRTQSLCLCDHAIGNPTSYFTKHYLGKPSYFNDLTFYKTKEPRFALIQRISKLFIYENYGGSIFWYDHTILKTIILKTFIGGFQKPHLARINS
jgi:hypothetical protein